MLGCFNQAGEWASRSRSREPRQEAILAPKEESVVTWIGVRALGDEEKQADWNKQ